MHSTTIIRSPGSIALGSLFAVGTCYVLFSDVTAWRQVTVDHVMTLLVLIGTIASGHMIWHQIRAWRVLPAAGLAVLFLAGTAYCVTTSAGRNAEATLAKESAIGKANAERERAQRDYDEAERRYKAALEAEEAECATGDGPKCKARRTTTHERRSDYEQASERLRAAPPPRLENAGLKHAAAVFAALPGVTADERTIERGLTLFGPFIKALFLEVATIVFLGLGLGHRHRPAQEPAATVSLPTAELVEIRERFFTPDDEPRPTPPTGPPRGARKRPPRRVLPPNVIPLPRAHPVIQALETANRPLTNRELARAMSVSDGEASKRWQEVAGHLDVCRQGKYRLLSLRRQTMVA